MALDMSSKFAMIEEWETRCLVIDVFAVNIVFGEFYCQLMLTGETRHEAGI